MKMYIYIYTNSYLKVSKLVQNWLLVKEIVILFFMLYNNIRFFETIIFKYKFNYLVSNKIKFYK